MPHLEDKFKSSEPPKSAEEKQADTIFAERQDEAAKCDLTEEQKLVNVKAQIERVKADHELEAVNKGYKSYQDAVIQLAKDRDQLETEKLKYPNYLTKEKELSSREEQINLSQRNADRYVSGKHIEADNYYNQKKQTADLYYKSSMEKLNKDSTEMKENLKEISGELDAKIKLYDENIEPMCTLMAKDARLIYRYLSQYIYPILENRTLKLFGTFNGQLSTTKQQAKITHNVLLGDAQYLLTMADKIKRGEK